jgi:hypothetical protein
VFTFGIGVSMGLDGLTLDALRFSGLMKAGDVGVGGIGAVKAEVG